MIGVYAVIPVKAEYAEAWEIIAQQLVQDTVSNDEGCVFYDFGKGHSQPDDSIVEYAFLERWMTLESLEAHATAEHHIAANKAWADYLAAPTQVKTYEF